MTEENTTVGVKSALLHLEINGWCVVEDVIPEDKVGPIRESVEKTVEAHGTYTGTEGVGTRKGLLAFNQSFAPYLADKRVLGIAETLFGPMCASLLQQHISTIRAMYVARCIRIGPSINTTPGIYPPHILMRSYT